MCQNRDSSTPLHWRALHCQVFYYIRTLDVSHAYLQLELMEESQDMVTINTYKNLYKNKWLLFGVAPTPDIFRRTMEATLQGLLMECVYLHDVLVSGKTQQEHLNNLNEVLTHLESAGLHLKEKKCTFCKPVVTYLRHIISANGLKQYQNNTHHQRFLNSKLYSITMPTSFQILPPDKPFCTSF